LIAQHGGVVLRVAHGGDDAAERVGEQERGRAAGTFIEQLTAQVVVVQTALQCATCCVVVRFAAEGVVLYIATKLLLCELLPCYNKLKEMQDGKGT